MTRDDTVERIEDVLERHDATPIWGSESLVRCSCAPRDSVPMRPADYRHHLALLVAEAAMSLD